MNNSKIQISNLLVWLQGTMVALTVSISLFFWINFLYYNWTVLGFFTKIGLIILPMHSVALIYHTALKALTLRSKELKKKQTKVSV